MEDIVSDNRNKLREQGLGFTGRGSDKLDQVLGNLIPDPLTSLVWLSSYSGPLYPLPPWIRDL